MIEPNKPISKTRAYTSLAAAVIVCAALITIGTLDARKREKERDLAEQQIQKKELVKPFVNPDTLARAVYVYDLKTRKVLFAKNQSVPLPIASLTKVMTAIVAEENASSSTTILLGKKDLETEGDNGLREGERWSLKSLLGFSLIESSNDGAVAVANSISALTQKDFVESMNEKATTLSLPSFSFKNSTGLDNPDETEAGAYGSAEDVAKLFSYALVENPDLFELTKNPSHIFSSIDNKKHQAKNTNSAIGDIPGLIAGKTGYTELAGGNLAVVFDAGLNHPVIIVVLGSTQDGRFQDVIALASSTINSL